MPQKNCFRKGKSISLKPYLSLKLNFEVKAFFQNDKRLRNSKANSLKSISNLHQIFKKWRCMLCCPLNRTLGQLNVQLMHNATLGFWQSFMILTKYHLYYTILLQSLKFKVYVQWTNFRSPLPPSNLGAVAVSLLLLGRHRAGLQGGEKLLSPLFLLTKSF